MKILSIIAAMCFAFLPQPAYSEDLKIGVALCLSGGCAEWGTAGLRGVQLAAKEINGSGGILGRPVVLAVEDTAEATMASVAVDVFNKTIPECLHYVGNETRAAKIFG